MQKKIMTTIMTTKMKNNKVVLGLSGGVDSTAAALLLIEKGYDVTGLFFDIQSENTRGREIAEAAASQLGIDFIYRNVQQEFEKLIIGNFCSEYAAARTPNPCIICNPLVKFKVLIDVADEIGAQYIATGHYADTACIDGTWYVTKAVNEKKDQSYMLYRLSEDVISRLILPLNEIDDKEKVRELARQKALKNSEAKDSQEICFIDENDNYKDFLERRGITAPKGNFVDSEGKVLGEHQGILNYTIGQRKGLGIALGKPAFVTCINCSDNTVVLGDNADLFRTEVISSDNVIKGGDGPVTAKIRYAARPADAEIEVMADGKIKTTFKEPQRAATPGQSIVFYRDNRVIGGGFIE